MLGFGNKSKAQQHLVEATYASDLDLTTSILARRSPDKFTFWNRVGTAFWVFLQSLRKILGLYSFDADELAAFNESIAPQYYRLRSDFFRLCKERGKYPCKDEIVEQLNALITGIDGNPETLTRSDLYTLESNLIAIADDEYLARFHFSLQERYRTAAGAQPYGRYEKSLPKELTAPQIRADSIFLSAEMRRLSITIPYREVTRTAILSSVLLVSLIAACLLIKHLLSPSHHHFPYLDVVSLMALFGGTISVVRRLQTTPDGELSIGQWGRVGLLISPLESMGFGVILYYLLAANFLSGVIFPDFTKVESAHPVYCVMPVDRKDTNLQQKTADSSAGCIWRSAAELADQGGSIDEWIRTFDFSQFAKLMVWSFLAGFAEQLVPDTLDALAKRQTASTAKSEPAKASGN